MEYLFENGEYLPLGRHNVDFGGGLERVTMISQNVDSFYETDIYKPVLNKVKELSKIDNLHSQRIIADHIKAAVLVIMDGVLPSNNMQGYVLRRLIRRAMRHARIVGIENGFTSVIGDICIDQFKQIYPQLDKQRNYILNELKKEEDRFNKTIDKGLKELDKYISHTNRISGKEIFTLYETYGLPKEVTEEILAEKNITVTNPESFEEAKRQHQEKSRSSSAGIFKGGLADTSEMSTKYHTATHLLLAALRKVLGDHVYQKGSNITSERLRLDFPNQENLTQEQLQKVEDLVNQAIKEKLPVTYEQLPKEEALKLVPFAAFKEKYGDTVKVYYIGDKENPFSIEICNGPHVDNTSELGTFKIIKQESVGNGIKRIKGVLN